MYPLFVMSCNTLQTLRLFNTSASVLIFHVNQAYQRQWKRHHLWRPPDNQTAALTWIFFYTPISAVLTNCDLALWHGSSSNQHECYMILFYSGLKLKMHPKPLPKCERNRDFILNWYILLWGVLVRTGPLYVKHMVVFDKIIGLFCQSLTHLTSPTRNTWRCMQDTKNIEQYYITSIWLSKVSQTHNRPSLDAFTWQQFHLITQNRQAQTYPSIRRKGWKDSNMLSLSQRVMLIVYTPSARGFFLTCCGTWTAAEKSFLYWRKWQLGACWVKVRKETVTE